MVCVKLQGGLGNQMFQYAAARGVSLGSKKILVDLSFLKHNQQTSEQFTARNFALDVFPNLKICVASSLRLQLYCSKSLPFIAARKLLLPGFRYVRQHGYRFESVLNNGHSNLYMDGYFQSERYFVKKRAAIVNEFAFPELDQSNRNYQAQIRQSLNAVCVHVRRGDYLKPEVLKHHGILPPSYYQNAIQRLNGLVEQPHYFVFSDDMDWCRNQLTFMGPKVTWMHTDNASTPWKDMCLMTECKHHIIANSSFSWWGAWLAGQTGVKIAPRNWFNPDNVSFEINDFVPGSWQIVDHG